MKRLLVTGSSGLVGSEVCLYFAEKGYQIHGIDNNQRAVFFGEQGDTRWNQQRLERSIKNFQHHELDIRDRKAMAETLQRIKPDVVIHAAAQPSHDKAAQIPYDDFDTNAGGTLNVLEALRHANPEAPFIHMSTNKVYGDGPNKIALKELETRWEYDDSAFENGIPENFPIDQTKHSIFGVSKTAADVMVQEYGRYFGMPACCLRGGCLTGPNHNGVELHGFLSYLVRCNVEGKKYSVYGYKGKQVRDNIHAYDIARFMEAFIAAPRTGEVYNLGGGKNNTCSILEAFEITQRFTGKPQVYEYMDKNRDGDHICYYSDLRKMKAHYPQWDITIGLEETIKQIAGNWLKRLQLETVTG
jgi:CDP-paratose 2-epimerase